MAIAITLKEYFDKSKTQYDFIKHRSTAAALDSSRAAHLPAEKVSKAVMLESENGDYLMASLPANSRLSLTEVQNITGMHYKLVSEEKLQELSNKHKVNLTLFHGRGGSVGKIGRASCRERV